MRAVFWFVSGISGGYGPKCSGGWKESHNLENFVGMLCVGVEKSIAVLEMM
jgi:hypothetical protein